MMKDYRRMMRQITLSDAKKEEIMKMIENKDTQKRRRPSVKVLVLAAALAVGCVLCTAAGLPAQVYNFVTGGTLVVTPAGGGIIGGVEMTLSGEQDEPIVLENGKLWFVNGEERTDITGLIDENTPYIYEHTDPATGNKGYVIMGGTMDDFGWAEYADLDGNSSLTGNNSFDYFVTLDGEQLRMTDLTEDQMKRLNEMENFTLETVYRPWLTKAMEQLGLELD